MSGLPQHDIKFRYRATEAQDVETTLAEARADLVVGGVPVRSFGWYAGMKHYPGWWWSSTRGDLVGYESLLERDRLMLSDFDREVVGIASQPFGITGRDGDTLRRHVPDYLLTYRDGSVLVVDVKPAELVDKPRVAGVLAWTGRLLAERGWRYEVWSGADDTYLANVRFLSQGRHEGLLGRADLTALLVHSSIGARLADVLGAAAAATGTERPFLQAAMLSLLWHQVWLVDLDRPLSGDTRIVKMREVDGERLSA